MSCEIKSFNNEVHSLLAKDLTDKVNNGNIKETESQIKYIRSDMFKKEFGDFEKAYNEGYVDENEQMSSRVDENGEPLLLYNEEQKKHYFLDKDNNKLYFPIQNKGLRGLMKYKDIEKITSRLAFRYFTNGKLDYNTIGLESGEKLPGLKSFIEQELKNKTVELLSSDNPKTRLSGRLTNLMSNHTDELTTEVQDFFKRISLKVVEDDNSINLDDVSEDVKDAGFGSNSIERDSKDSISTNIKLKLSLLEDSENLDPIWGESTFRSFNEVYSTLATVMTNNVALEGEDIWEVQKDALKSIINKKPYLLKLYAQLSDKSFTDDMASEFSQAFNLTKNKIIVSEQVSEEIDSENWKGEKTKVKTGGISYRSVDITDSGSKTNSVLNNWFQSFKSIYTTDLGIPTAKFKTILPKLDEVIKKLHSDYMSLSNSDNYDYKEEKIIVESFLSKIKNLGIDLTPNAFENYLDNTGKNNTLNYRKNQINKAFSAIETSIENLTTELGKGNPITEGVLSKSSSIYRTLAKNQAFFLEEGTDSSVLAGGKPKYIYSYPSYLSTKIAQWKKDPKLILEWLNGSEYNKSSDLLNYLGGVIDEYGQVHDDQSETEQLQRANSRLENFDLGVFTQMTVDDEFAKTTDLSFKDYLTDNVNKILLNDFARTITQADKTLEYQVKNGLEISAFDDLEIDENNKEIPLVTSRTKKIFTKYFTSEYNRMIEASNDIQNSKDGRDLTIHYHFKKGKNIFDENGNIVDKNIGLGNAFKSQYFERLSPGIKGLTDIEKQIHEILYLDGKPRLSKLNENIEPELTDLLERYIEGELVKGVAKTFNTLIENELFEIKDDGSIKPKNIDKDVLAKYKKYEQFGDNAQALALATNYYINSLYNSIEYTKMFTGDVAYYKDIVDFKKRIPATYTDGLQLRIQEGQENFKASIINSVMRTSPFYDKLVESLGKDASKPYSDFAINSADAQAWITPARWKFLIKGLGKWSKVHDSIYSKMNSDTPIEYTEKELKIAAQPLKGVYFYTDKNGKPTYLKYSQAVLSKQMIKGQDIEKLYDKMVKTGTDEVITLDGIKVGALSPTTIHNEEGQIINDFELNPMTLSNRGWKLQQDLPTKTYKDTDVGSQIQKNIFAGLLHRQDNDQFLLDGNKVTGRDIMDEIVKAVSGLNQKGLDKIKKEFKLDKDYKIGDISGFYNTLINELIKRDGSQNIIDALKAEVSLPGIPQAGSKLTNVFASIMNDRLIKIKTNGGSFIQMANFGFNKSEGNQIGVMWAPYAFETTNEPFITKDDDGNETVTPGGVLVSSAFIVKYIPNWRGKTSEELFGTYEDGVLVKKGMIDERILDSLIGYRIPNQGLASNDALRIVGILPESAGDTIVAYTGITTKTGSDFDVDKMYIMFPSTTNDKEGLKYDTEDLGNRLIELYKSTLLHPEVYRSSMVPIDTPIISDAITSLDSKKSKENLNGFEPIDDIQLRYSLIDGKAGVGMEANALVDISREADLSYKDYYLGWGHQNTNGETVLDNEFAVQLVKRDLDYYLDELESTIKKGDLRYDRNEYSKLIENVKVGDSLTAILNAFVDIAKDPFITRGNWTSSTTNIGNLMLRAGTHPLYVTHFLSQPIIKEYVDFQKNQEGLTSDNSGDIDNKFKKFLVEKELLKLSKEHVIIYKNNYKAVNIDNKIAQLDYELENGYITPEEYTERKALVEKNSLNALGKASKSLNKEDKENLPKIINEITKVHNSIFDEVSQNTVTDRSLQYLREQISKQKDNAFQMEVLAKFIEMRNYSKSLREKVLFSRQDTDGMGKNINSLMRIFNLKNHIKAKEGEKGSLQGIDSSLDNTTLEVYHNSLKDILKIVQNNPLIFPQASSKIQDVFNQISYDLYNTVAINEGLMDDLEIAFNSYLMGNFKPFNFSKEESNTLLSNLPLEFQMFKNENKGKYFIIDELEVKKNSIGLSNRKKDSIYEKSFIDSWKDLLTAHPKLGEDLIKYSVLTSSFKMNSSQFFTFIPYNYFVANSINAHVSNFTRENEYNDFLDLFYRNNMGNTKYVKKVFNTPENPISSSSPEFGFRIKGVVKKTPLYVEYNSNYYKLEALNAVQDSYGEVKGYEPVYLAVKPAYTIVNGKKINNYNTHNNEDIYNMSDELLTNFRTSLSNGNVDGLNLDRNGIEYKYQVSNSEITEEEGIIDYQEQDLSDLMQEEYNNLSEEEKATIEWQKKNCK